MENYIFLVQEIIGLSFHCIVFQVAACDFHVSDRANNWCDMIGAKYVRFNPILQSEIELNEKDDRILLSMIIEARRFILKNIEELQSLADILTCRKIL